MEEKKLGRKENARNKVVIGVVAANNDGKFGAPFGYISRLFAYTDTDTSSLYCMYL